MATYTSDSKSVEIASGEIVSMQMNYDGSTVYTPEVQIAASDVRGCDVKSVVHAADVVMNLVKATSGVLYGFDIGNQNGGMVFLRFYDLSAAATAAGETSWLRFGCASADAYGRFFLPGLPFSNGCFFVATTDEEDAAAAAVTASKVVVNVYYK